ncbi:MAG: hypothetical protein ACK53Y_20455, partial [bacterium]
MSLSANSLLRRFTLLPESSNARPSTLYLGLLGFVITTLAKENLSLVGLIARSPFVLHGLTGGCTRFGLAIPACALPLGLRPTTVGKSTLYPFPTSFSTVCLIDSNSSNVESKSKGSVTEKSLPAWTPQASTPSGVDWE